MSENFQSVLLDLTPEIWIFYFDDVSWFKDIALVVWFSMTTTIIYWHSNLICESCFNLLTTF